MSEKERDQAYAQQRSSALRSSVLFRRIRDRIIANRHSVASSLATSTIAECPAATHLQSKPTSCHRRRLEFIQERFVHRYRQLRWKFREFVQRYAVSLLHCFGQRIASTVEALNRLTEGNKHQIQRCGVVANGFFFFRFRFRAKKTKRNNAF